MKIEVVLREISSLFAFRSIPVKVNDLVLDVGSGDNPHVRADVLCDANLMDCEERCGKFDLIIDGRPFIFADACKLPFKDKAFDFIISRHLLEHMSNPAILLEELMRVGKAGYIESPSSLMEKLYGWSFHRLLIDCEKDCLIIRPKPKDEKFGILPEKIKRNPCWGKVVGENTDFLLVSYFWQDKIKYRVEGTLPEEVEEEPEEFLTITKPSIKRRLRWWVTKSVRFLVARPKFRIEEILACPECHGEVRIDKEGVVCSQCKTIYPIIEKKFFKFV
jgi:SAM-dependent methyltransferase